MKPSTKFLLITGISAVSLAALGNAVVAKNYDWQHSSGIQSTADRVDRTDRVDGMQQQVAELGQKQAGTATATSVEPGISGQYQALDQNRDGNLNLSEFEKKRMANDRQLMATEFQRMDSNGDGKVTEDEFRASMNGMMENNGHHDNDRLSFNGMMQDLRDWRNDGENDGENRRDGEYNDRGDHHDGDRRD